MNDVIVLNEIGHKFCGKLIHVFCCVGDNMYLYCHAVASKIRTTINIIFIVEAESSYIAVLLDFLQLKEEYWRSLFKIIFIEVNYETGNKICGKIWTGLSVEQSWRVEQKELFFLFIRLFTREREIEM